MEALKVAVIGLTHTHVHWIFNSEKNGDIEILAIVEPDKALAQRYSAQHGFDMAKVFATNEEMLAKVRPEAVTAFGSIKAHLEVVRNFAPLGIHIMVEKPLALNLDQAKEMKALAEANKVLLLTNYETTWYPTHQKAYDLIKEGGKIGGLRKAVVRDGHKGPLKIGINTEFLEWLTDPELNGGGALMDFGCYGANVLTWLNEGRKPLRVSAITSQLQAENNPKVEDESIIVLDYGDMTAIVQGSWNWPIGRKDMSFYGETGEIIVDNGKTMHWRKSVGYDDFEQESYEPKTNAWPYHDPFSYFAARIRGRIGEAPYEPSSLENNMIVMEILNAAKESAETGKVVELAKKEEKSSKK